MYLDLAKRKIEKAQVQALVSGQTDARTLLESTVPGGLGVAPALPVEQLERMVLGTRPGTPLGTLLAGLGEQAAREARETLIEGVALGLGTREIGRNLRTSFGGNAIRSLLVARTETIRVYRQAALQTYRKNHGVVQGWIWVAALGPRTCPVCIARHGSFHPLDEEFASHPACRCSPAPATRSWADLGFEDVPETKIKLETGEGWFARQDRNTQRAILGPGKLRLYEDGELRLEDVVQETVHPVWGRGLRERPLRDLIVRRERGSGIGGGFSFADIEGPLPPSPRRPYPEPSRPTKKRRRTAPKKVAKPSSPGNLSTRVQELLGVPAQAHSMPSKKLKVSYKRLRDGTIGQYAPGRSEMWITTATIQPTRLAEAVVHEFGHFIDYEVLGEDGRPGSAVSSKLDAWRRAVKASRAYKELGRRRGKYSTYLRTDHELFARSYTQWIARKTRHGDLATSVEWSHAMDDAEFWDDADFRPIEKELDELFSRHL